MKIALVFTGILICHLAYVTVDIITAAQQASLDAQAEAFLSTGPRPEFGTYPPRCEGLTRIGWQICMGVRVDPQ